MQPRREMLVEYDYSVRVGLASSAICGGGEHAPSVALKLHLRSTADGSNSERQVMLELTPEQLATLLDDFARISKELTRTS